MIIHRYALFKNKHSNIGFCSPALHIMPKCLKCLFLSVQKTEHRRWTKSQLEWGHSKHFLPDNQECCHRSSWPKEREMSSLIQALNFKASLQNGTHKNHMFSMFSCACNTLRVRTNSFCWALIWSAQL